MATLSGKKHWLEVTIGNMPCSRTLQNTLSVKKECFFIRYLAGCKKAQAPCSACGLCVAGAASLRCVGVFGREAERVVVSVYAGVWWQQGACARTSGRGRMVVVKSVRVLGGGASAGPIRGAKGEGQHAPGGMGSPGPEALW